MVLRRRCGQAPLGFEALEPRWTPTWAGIPPTSILPPAAPAVVSLNTQGDASGTAAITAGEIDYFSFTATSTGSYAISATTPSSSLDTVLGVFSATGQRLGYNDDTSALNTDSRLSINLTAGAKYYFGITNYSSSTLGNYSWAIDGPAATVAADDSYEDNDSRATAYNLGTLSAATTVGSLVMADSQDWYRFTTTATGTAANSVSIAFQHAQGDLDLELYNSAGTLLARSQGTSNSEAISFNGLAAGTYYARVYGYRGALNPAYSLSINPATAAPVTPPTTSPVTAFPDVAYYGGNNEWSLNSINAPEAWAKGYRGDGVVVAVIDTGVDLNHPDLVNQIWVNAGEIAGNGADDDHNGYVDDVQGWDFSSSDNNPDDQNGHGTHVAGSIAAEANGFGATGVAPDATIMPVRVLDSNGSGTMSGVAAGIRYAARMGADIVNLSLGGGYSSVLQSALQYAQQLGVLVVAAAGNESASTPGYPARFSSSLTNVLSVGAYSSSGTIASFSNDVGTSGAVQVDAPGVSVYSTYIDGRYTTMSGTSMATPQVAGMAALALSANHNLTAAQLRDVIVNGANHTIAGSDARGGINAALTVALAAAGQTSSTAAAATVATRSTSQLFSFSRLSLLSSSGVESLSNATSDSTEPVNGSQPRSVMPAANPASQAILAHVASHDQALVELSCEDEDFSDPTSSATESELLLDAWLSQVLGQGNLLALEQALAT